MANRFESHRRNGAAYEWFNLHEILVGADLEFLRRPPYFNLRIRLLRLVKPMETANHPFDFLFAYQTFREQLTQGPAALQLSHLDAVLGDCLLRHSGCGGWISFCIEGKTGSALVNRNHSQVDVRTEPAIQFKLALAKVTALFKRAEIKKAEVHRLLDFENKWRRHQYPRDVCLQRAHFRRPVRIRSGRFKK